MNKYSVLIAAVIIIMCSSIGNVANAQGGCKPVRSTSVYLGTVHGVIGDSMCKNDHKAMINGGYATDAAMCTDKCVVEGSKLVLVEKKSNTVYTFKNSKEAKTFAGKSVAITGHIDPKTRVIDIQEVKAE